MAGPNCSDCFWKKRPLPRAPIPIASKQQHCHIHSTFAFLCLLSDMCLMFLEQGAQCFKGPVATVWGGQGEEQSRKPPQPYHQKGGSRGGEAPNQTTEEGEGEQKTTTTPRGGTGSRGAEQKATIEPPSGRQRGRPSPHNMWV